MSDHLRERRIAGSRVYTGKILDLEVDRVVLPNGHETVREVVRHRGAVVILPLLGDGDIIFVRQFRYPVGTVLLELPAGKLDPGEPPEACARRELEEETRYGAGRLRLLGAFFTTPGFTDERITAFLAEDLVPRRDAEPDEDEFLDVVRIPSEQALEMAREGRLDDAKTLATLFLWRVGLSG